MTALYTFDVFTTLDGFGSFDGGDWGGYWGKQGPEFLDHRADVVGEDQRMVLGATTFRQFMTLIGGIPEDEIDPVITGRTGTSPVLRDAADFDLELLESRTYDGRIQELVYRPTLHG
ncbi:hypothetical protein [Isoptericola variabilis]|uniref:Deaminase n=1 Tax=Isoptericola variabilis (strain 225) TaxID=743718 RepID=F6FUR0_ISOV2|nr:hypothetical protein [Isoptericola variabilis]AEG43321.1 hypothetical protein Isova_0525 [Isoptericola variabilis 225]TWH35257.1 hypothetical protein L600_000100002610 [Isoptericola variabilis J7]